MQTVCELAKIAAHSSVVVKKANPALLARGAGMLSRLGQGAARMAPKSMAGRAAAGLGAAGGMHLGQDAVRSYNTAKPDLQQYYDQNQFAAKALGEQAARMKAPSGFPETSVGQLVGQNAPQLDVDQPTSSLMRFLARPVHETRMNMGGDPGAYVPPQAQRQVNIGGPPPTKTNPDGTMSTFSQPTALENTSQHSNRSRFAKWRAEMDAAQTQAATGRYGQQAAEVLPAAQKSLEQNIAGAQGAHQSGSSQYSQSRNNMSALWRQLGLDPSVMPKDLQAPDLSKPNQQLDTLRQMGAGQELVPKSQVDEARQQAVQQWLQQQSEGYETGAGGSPVPTPAARPAAPAGGAGMGDPDAMRRRANRMRDLSRTWNAY
jgi:hypothetical protein